VEAGEQHGHRTKKILEIDPIQAETVRLIFRLAREGDGTPRPMGVKSITNHLNAAGIHTRDGGRWGIGAVHKVLTRSTYIEAAEYEAVQAPLETRSPALTAPRITSGPTLLTGICFCAGCGMAMTLRTGGALPVLLLLDQGAAGRDRLQGPDRPDGEARYGRRRSYRARASAASRKSCRALSTVAMNAPSGALRTSPNCVSAPPKRKPSSSVCMMRSRMASPICLT
jgi:hypothetical protein